MTSELGVVRTSAPLAAFAEGCHSLALGAARLRCPSVLDRPLVVATSEIDHRLPISQGRLENVKLEQECRVAKVVPMSYELGYLGRSTYTSPICLPRRQSL
jgi:hypothetical protein